MCICDQAPDFAAIVQTIDDAILSKNIDGFITAWNPGAERMYGYSAKEAIGQHVSLLATPENPEETPWIMERIARGESVDHYETERVRKDGRRILVSVSISPVIDPKTGSILGAAAIARDITEKRHAEEAIVRSEKLALAGRMMAAVAHEINNPLEAITNLLYLLKSEQMSETAKHYLDVAEGELVRVSQVSRQALAFYRDNTSPTNILLSELVENTAFMLNRKLMSKHIKVVRNYRNGHILARAGEIRQVIANLIGNAIDAMSDRGQLTLKVRHGRYHGRSGVWMTIGDTGTGIQDSALDTIFEPFFTTKGSTGTGLGLWVVRKLVEKSGGAITVKTSTRLGHSWTAFSVFLPEKPEIFAPKLLNTEASAASAGSGTAQFRQEAA